MRFNAGVGGDDICNVVEWAFPIIPLQHVMCVSSKLSGVFPTDKC